MVGRPGHQISPLTAKGRELSLVSSMAYGKLQRKEVSHDHVESIDYHGFLLKPILFKQKDPSLGPLHTEELSGGIAIPDLRQYYR